VTWTKLEKSNDWGHEYLAPAGQVHSPTGGADASRRVRIPVGAQIRIRWPNGTIESLSVVEKHKTSTVGDMGHDYTVSYELPGVIIDHNGRKQWVSLEGLEVDLLDEWLPRKPRKHGLVLCVKCRFAADGICSQESNQYHRRPIELVGSCMQGEDL
jgi:hypothetical protein